jgi:hypothetical protein
MAKQPNYSLYVEHPRYGKSPRYTGLDPDPNEPGVRIHSSAGILSDAAIAYMRWRWGDLLSAWSGPDMPVAIPGTAVEADTSRQVSRPVQVTHYYDLDVCCRGCKRRFIFFADEQKFWYEELQLPLESTAVRCCECRKEERRLAGLKKRYEVLCHVDSRSPEENLEMAGCCFTLIEEGVFHPQQSQHVRQLLNTVPEEYRGSEAYVDLRARVGGRE